MTTPTDTAPLKTRYKFVHFMQTGAQYSGRPMWYCLNNRTFAELAFLAWYPTWKQWVMQANSDAVFSADCLADIQHFIGQLKASKP